MAKPVTKIEQKEETSSTLEKLLNSAMDLAPTQSIKTNIARALAELKFIK